MHGPFLLDDHASLVLLAEDDRSLRAWIERLLQAPEHVRQRVVSNLSFMTNQALAGAWTSHTPFPFKLGNLLIHLLCAAAVLALARRLALLMGADPARAAWTGVLAAALFALHPLQISTTLYVVQRMAQLSALFSLLAVLAYIRWRMEIGRVGDVRNVLNLLLVPLFALLAFLSKENGALVPLYLLVIELCFFRFPAGAFRPAKAGSGESGPSTGGAIPPAEIKARFEMGYGLLAAGPVLAALAALPFLWSRFSGGYALRDFSMVERLLTQVHALGHYIGLILWPRVGAMGLYRDDFPVTSSLDLNTVLLGAALLALAIVAVVLRRRAPVLAFAVLWFFACHAMESSFIALELVFEHRNYLALFGPALALSFALTGIRRPQWLAPVAATVVLTLLAMQSRSRAQAWSSYESWLQHETMNRPASLRAGTDLVFFLANRGRFDEAVAVVESMRTHHPQSGHPTLAAISLRCWQNEPSAPSAEEIEGLRNLHLGKDSYHLFSTLVELKESGRCETLDGRMIGRIAGAVADNPQVARHRTSAAAWRRHEAHALMRESDWPRAQESLEAVLELRDNDPRDWLALARARLMQGDVEGYRQARAGLLNLLPRPEGVIAQELAALDAVLMRALKGHAEP